MLLLRPILLLLLIVGGPSTVDAGNPTDPREQQLEILRQNLTEQEERLAAAKQREGELQAELDRLDGEVEQQQQELAALNRRLEQQQQQKKRKEQELERLKAEREQNKKNVQRRLAAAYQSGELEMLNVLFSAESLPKLLELQDYFKIIRQHDQAVINQYREQIERLQEARHNLAILEAELKTARATISYQEEQLRASREERAAVLRQARNQRHLHEQARREIAAATDRLTAALSGELEHDESATDGRSPSADAEGFPGDRGSMTWPAAGTVATEFGQTVTGRLGNTDKSRGITIETVAGARVKAIYQGTVAHVGEMEGYGKMIIIEHGQRYFSLLAGLAEVETGQGEVVRQGQPLGTVSASDGAESKGQLYLEIRHRVDPLDPMEWLRDGESQPPVILTPEDKKQ